VASGVSEIEWQWQETLTAISGFIASGVGIQSAIEGADAGQLNVAIRTVLCGGIRLYQIGLTAVQWAAPRSPNWILGGRMLAASACIALVGVGGFLAPVALMGLLALILIGLIRFQSHSSKSLESSGS